MKILASVSNGFRCIPQEWEGPTPWRRPLPSPFAGSRSAGATRPPLARLRTRSKTDKEDEVEDDE